MVMNKMVSFDIPEHQNPKDGIPKMANAMVLSECKLKLRTISNKRQEAINVIKANTICNKIQEPNVKNEKMDPILHTKNVSDSL